MSSAGEAVTLTGAVSQTGNAGQVTFSGLSLALALKLCLQIGLLLVLILVLLLVLVLVLATMLVAAHDELLFEKEHRVASGIADLLRLR